MNWTIKKIANICNGEILFDNEGTTVNNFSIDTRTINQGDTYLGIKGENFDGNLFYDEAFKKGAILAILNKNIKDKIKKIDKPIILVENTIVALAKLARAKLDELKIPIIAITGSVGKTSTKDIVCTVLSQKYHVFKPIKNYNNAIGLPISILSIKDEQVAVLEMGMSELGEIANLSKIARPDIAIITNIFPVHIESLKTMENILKAKLEIVEGFKKNSLLIINNDNEYLRNAKVNCPVITCGIENDSILQVINLTENTFTINYQNEKIIFEHNNLTKPFIQNVLLAIATGIKLKIPFNNIKEAIKNFVLTAGRLEHIELKNDILLINDAYNANCESMKNAIDYLKKQKGKRKIAILGNMRELGAYSQELHSEVGRYINSNKLNYLFTIGDDAKHIHDYAKLENKKHFNNKNNLYSFLEGFIEPDDTIIIKASNGEKFTELIDFIKGKF